MVCCYAVFLIVSLVVMGLMALTWILFRTKGGITLISKVFCIFKNCPLNVRECWDRLYTWTSRFERWNIFSRYPFTQRDYREGWQKKWGLLEYIWKEPSLVGLLGLSCSSKIFLSCLGCSSWPIKYFSIYLSFSSTFLQWSPRSCSVLPQPESLIGITDQSKQSRMTN